MTKYIIVAVIVCGVILGGIALKSNEVEEFVAPAVVEKLVTQEVEVETLQKRIDDAITASSTDIESASQKAYEDMKTQMRKEIELQVRTAYENELKAKRIELEKEVGAY